MSVERILQIHIALLITIGGVLFGMAEGNPAIPALAAVAAISSVVLTDALGWFRLNRLVANLGSLAALFFSLDAFLVGNSRLQLVAIAKLLVYLQVLILFQRKNSRLYGQLAVLSLLQVVVSAALNAGVEFALVLVLYAAIAISTMCVFFVYREIDRAAQPVRLDSADAPQVRPVDLLASTPKTRATASSQRLGKQILGWGLTRQTMALTAATFVFALVLFYAVPRSDSARSLARRLRTVHVTGFSYQVRLQELGEVLDSQQPVMRVSFRDLADQTSYRVTGDPYFRGSVLTDYAIIQGVPCWRQRGQMPIPGIRRTSAPREWSLPEPPEGSYLVRQDIVLEPLDTPVLFGVFPMYAIPQTPPETFVDPVTDQVTYMAHDGPRQLHEVRFSSATTGFLGGLQLEITPHRGPLPRLEREGWLEQERRRLLRIDRSRFPNLVRIASEINQQQQSRGGGTVSLAKALRDHFLQPGAYEYTTRFDQIPRRPDLDPIEDFVANHRQGHCEYFASALVMMLRSQGIPARLVIGYHGGEYNPLGDYYQVVQGNAHAWVEAYLDPAIAERALPDGADLSPSGGWLRLEPTPGAAEESGMDTERTAMDVADDLLAYARTMWTDYVLGLSAKRQRDAVYGSMAATTSMGSWESLLEKLTGDRESSWQSLRWHLLRWAGLIAVVGMSVVFARYLRQPRDRAEDSPMTRIVRRLSRELGRETHLLARRRGRTAIDFYRRFEGLLAARGLTRGPGETPAEFARRTAGELDLAVLESDGLQSSERIVDAFYRVRFGRYILTDSEVVRLEQDLLRIQASCETPSGLK
jgi:hypothetical protein